MTQKTPDERYDDERMDRIESEWRVFRKALDQIAYSNREDSCNHPDCNRYGDRPQSRALQNIAKKAVEKGEWDGLE